MASAIERYQADWTEPEYIKLNYPRGEQNLFSLSFSFFTVLTTLEVMDRLRTPMIADTHLAATTISNSFHVSYSSWHWNIFTFKYTLNVQFDVYQNLKDE